VRLTTTLIKIEEVHELNELFLFVTLPNIHRFKKITDRLSSKTFFI